MKYSIAGLILALSICAFVGCKSVPSADTVYLVANAGGTATALVMNETTLDTEKRIVIRDIMNEVRDCTPEVGQTLEAAWTPIAKEHVNLLIQEGKIDAATGDLILAGFKTVMVGVNLIENRYPKIRAYRDLTDSAIAGFTDGFIAKFVVNVGNFALLVYRFDIDRSVVQEVRRAAIRNGLK